MPAYSRALYVALLLIALILFSTLSFLVYASIFTYRWVSGYTSVSPPVVWFEDPKTPNASVSLYNYKTSAVVDVYARNVGLRLVGRSGVVGDLRNSTYVNQYFELYGKGCDFQVTSDGSGIYVYGNPGGGLYGGCTLRYRYPPGTFTNVSFATLMKTTDITPADGIRGVSLWNSTTGYYYLAGVKNNGTGWFFGIYKYGGSTIREPGGPSLPALRDVRIASVSGYWFAISFTVIRNPDGSVTLRAWLYNISAGGRLVAYIEVTDRTSPIYPDNFGLTVFQIRQQPSAIFQILGFTTSIYVIVVRGLVYCCSVYVYDSAGNLIGYGHANESGVAVITLTNPSALNPTVNIVCNGASYTIPLNVLLGGDMYEIFWWFEGTILMVYTNMLNYKLSEWLKVLSVSCTGSIYRVELWLRNATTSSSRIIVMQSGGNIIVYPDSTNVLVLTPSQTGWLANISMRAELYINSFCTIYTNLYYSYSPNLSTYGALDAKINIVGG
jgi:hypothetical protein